MRANDLSLDPVYAFVMLDVRRLRVLREVAAQGSFSAAAEALAFTQPAVSRQIATLEAEAGARLVERGARGIRLTPAGELLLEHAEVILDRLAAAEHQLDALSGLDGGRLRIGAFPTANWTLIPLALTAFDGEYPSVCLSLRECTTGEAGPLLAAGELDLAVVSDAGDPGEDIELEHLMDDPMHLALPRSHHLVDKPEISMTDLRDEIWIEGRDGICRTKLMRAAERAGFEPRVAFQSTEWLGKQGLVAGGGGGTRIPPGAAAPGRGREAPRAAIVLPALPDGPTRTISIATPSSRYRAPGVEPMRKILQRVAAEHCFA